VLCKIVNIDLEINKTIETNKIKFHDNNNSLSPVYYTILKKCIKCYVTTQHNYVIFLRARIGFMFHYVIFLLIITYVLEFDYTLNVIRVMDNC